MASVEESADRDSFPAQARVLGAPPVIIGLLGVALLCAVTPFNDYHLHQTYLYGNHFPLGALFLFIIIIGINTLLRCFLPARTLTQKDLLAIWIMLITGGALASSGLMRYLGPVPIAPFYYATDSNHWAKWTNLIPAWMVPSRDPNSPIIKWFFEGMPDGGHIPWEAWFPVFIWWGLLLAMLAIFSICTSAILYRQWVRAEKLSFPLVHIPLAMSAEPEVGFLNGFLRSRWMWAGCAFTALFHLNNGLHYYFLPIPEIPRYLDLSLYLQNRPWNAVGSTSLEVFFSVVGLCFLVPSEVSASLWGFYILFQMTRVLRVSFGMDPLSPTTPNHEVALNIGGFLAWSGWMAWSARAYLFSLSKQILTGRRESSWAEPLSPRAASIGCLLSFAGMIIWMMAAGLSFPFAFLLIACFLLILVVLTRIVAESGLLFVQTPFVPTDLMTAIPGSQMFNQAGIPPAMVVQTVLMHDPRESLMPSTMNAMKIGGRWSGRELILIMASALAAGYLVSFVSFLIISYKYGGVNLDAWGNINAPRLFYTRVQNYIESPAPLNRPATSNIAAGAAFTAFLLMMRARFAWWNFHPIGFLLAGTYAMQRIWFSIFLAWGIKHLILKYGGFRFFRMALPFFLGMAIGEGLAGGIWVVVGMITGVGTPTFLPN